MSTRLNVLFIVGLLILLWLTATSCRVQSFTVGDPYYDGNRPRHGTGTNLDTGTNLSTGEVNNYRIDRHSIMNLDTGESSPYQTFGHNGTVLDLTTGEFIQLH